MAHCSGQKKVYVNILQCLKLQSAFEVLMLQVQLAYRRIGLSGTLHCLVHPAYQAHALFFMKSAQTLDNG